MSTQFARTGLQALRAAGNIREKQNHEKMVSLLPRNGKKQRADAAPCIINSLPIFNMTN